MIPVYTDEADRETSPHAQEDWFAERMSWKWMNTIMRVNSLVQKVRVIPPANHAYQSRPVEPTLRAERDGGLTSRRSLLLISLFLRSHLLTIG